MNAIGYYYPKINFRLVGSNYLSLQIDPSEALSQWILKLDQLYIQQNNSLDQSIGIIQAAYFHWLKLLANSKIKQIDKERRYYSTLNQEGKLEFLLTHNFEQYLSKVAMTQFYKTGCLSSDISAIKEIEKWRSKCAVLKEELEPTRCCLIL